MVIEKLNARKYINAYKNDASWKDLVYFVTYILSLSIFCPGLNDDNLILFFHYEFTTFSCGTVKHIDALKCISRRFYTPNTIP